MTTTSCLTGTASRESTPRGGAERDGSAQRERRDGTQSSRRRRAERGSGRTARPESIEAQRRRGHRAQAARIRALARVALEHEPVRGEHGVGAAGDDEDGAGFVPIVR